MSRFHVLYLDFDTDSAKPTLGLGSNIRSPEYKVFYDQVAVKPENRPALKKLSSYFGITGAQEPFHVVVIRVRSTAAEGNEAVTWRRFMAAFEQLGLSPDPKVVIVYNQIDVKSSTALGSEAQAHLKSETQEALREGAAALFGGQLEEGILLGYIQHLCENVESERFLGKLKAELEKRDSDLLTHKAWEPIFALLRKETRYDRATVQVIGETMDEERPRPGKDRYYRTILTHDLYSHPDQRQVQPLERDEPDNAPALPPLSHESEIDLLEILKARKPYILPNAKKDIGFAKSDVVSWICLPLVLGNKLVGLITLDKVPYKAPHDTMFQDVNLEVLQRAGDMIASALDAAFERRRLRASRRVMQKISPQNELRKLLREIAREIVHSLEPGRNNTTRVLRCCFFKREDFPHPNDTEKFDSKFVKWVDDHNLYLETREAIEGGDEDKPFTDSDGIVGRFLKEKSPGPQLVYSLEDKREDARPSRTGIHSMLAVPVTVQVELENQDANDQEPKPRRRRNPKQPVDRLISVITVDSRLVGAFCQYDIDLVELLARQAAVVIERTWMLELVQQTGMRLGGDEKLDDLMALIYDNAKEITNATSGAIILFEKGQDVYRIAKQYPVDQFQKLFDDEGNGEQVSAQDMLSPRLKREKLDVFISKMGPVALNEDQMPEGIKHTDPKPKCAIAMRIAVRDTDTGLTDILGAFYLASNSKKKFNEIELAALQIFANFAAVAIRSAQLKEGAVLLEKATREVMSKDSLDEALSTIADRARELVDAQCAFVSLLKNDKADIRLAAVSPADRLAELQELEQILSLRPDKTKGEQKGITGLVIEQNRKRLGKHAYVLINHMTDRKRYPEYVVDKLPAQSELAVPILALNSNPDIHAYALGTLNVQHNQQGAFRSTDVRLIQRFAAVAATAITRFYNPPHSSFRIVEKEKQRGKEIFLALKFDPKHRREWVTRQVSQAADVYQKCAGYAEVRDQIPDAVWTQIASCDIFIADISGENEGTKSQSVNVFYEIGLAHALNKPVILIGEMGDQLPTDMNNLVLLNYRKYTREDLSDDQDFIESLTAKIGEYLNIEPSKAPSEVK